MSPRSAYDTATPPLPVGVERSTFELHVRGAIPPRLAGSLVIATSRRNKTRACFSRWSGVAKRRASYSPATRASRQTSRLEATGVLSVSSGWKRANHREHRDHREKQPEKKQTVACAPSRKLGGRRRARSAGSCFANRKQPRSRGERGVARRSDNKRCLRVLKAPVHWEPPRTIVSFPPRGSALSAALRLV